MTNSGAACRQLSRSPGTGTFFGEEGTNPAVGQSGKLETSEEVRAAVRPFVEGPIHVTVEDVAPPAATA